MTKMIFLLDEFFSEIKDVEDLLDSEEFTTLDAKYVKGFKDCLEVVTRKSMELAFEAEVDVEELPVSVLH